LKRNSLPFLFLLFLLCAAFRLHARPQMEEGRLFPLPEAGPVKTETTAPSPVPEPILEGEPAFEAEAAAPAALEPAPETEIAAPAAEEAPAALEPPPETEIAAPAVEEAPAAAGPVDGIPPGPAPPETADAPVGEVPAEEEGAAETPSPGPPPPKLAEAPSPAPKESAEPAPSETAASEPAARNRPFVIFNEGVTASWLTRIITQSGRSNFVFKDFLPGLYFGMELVNLKSVFPKFPLVPQLRLAAYYPLRSTFNDIPQPAKLPLHIAADAILGAGIKINALRYVRFSLTPGVHFFFLNSERWNYFNLGAVGILGMELPVSSGWTVLINGMASFDNGNLGKNQAIEPFDIVYQYQVDVGVRFSKKARNEYPWIKPRAPKSPRP
jgi:hypothetical protein